MKFLAGMVAFGLFAAGGFGLFFIEPVVQLQARGAPASSSSPR